MYEISKCNLDMLYELEEEKKINTIFKTRTWLEFLKDDKQVEPVILQINDNNKVVAYFVGLVFTKMGFRILGSPFEGWLTPDMGFIVMEELDFNEALCAVAKYAFKYLRCWYVQITDKAITKEMLSERIHYYLSDELLLDNTKNIDEVLAGFTKNGRRDVRAAERKEVLVKKVLFDGDFVDKYYSQLIDVFDKQGLRPFYSIEKLYKIVENISQQERILALEAYLPTGECIATLFSFGYGEWAYYMGAASYREYQNHLPNEKLFWEMLKYWNDLKIPYVDLVGYRKYKMKYSPQVLSVPTIYFERVPGIYFMKNKAKECVKMIRKIKSVIKR